MTDPNRQSNARDELERAERALQAATVLLAEGLLEDSISRSYYAMLHAARALLLADGLEATTHKGVARLLHREFIRSGRFPADLGQRLHQAMDFRELADYDVNVHFSAPEAQEQLDLARDFCRAVRTFPGSSP